MQWKGTRRVCEVTRSGGVTLAVLMALLVAPIAAVHASQPASDEASRGHAATAGPDIEAAETAAPVLVGGEPVFWVATGVGPYTAQYRADRITGRVREVIHDRTISDMSVTVTDDDGASVLRVGAKALMVVTPQDAKTVGVPRPLLAQQLARDLEGAIRAERLRHSPAALARSGVYSALATAALLGALWAIRRLTRTLRASLGAWRASGPLAVRLQQVEIVSAGQVHLAVDRLVTVLQAILILLVLHVYLTYVLGLFPWTRAASFTLLDSVLTPLRSAAAAFFAYLPNLLFVVVIAALVYVAIRAAGLFFGLVERGRLVFPKFPAEWATPTHMIVRVLFMALGVVIAFPYLPASDSPAFAGVSVFMGVLISLASTSSLSNMIAGLVLTYTGAFRLGDRVKVGDTYGDIIDTSLLATRIRTIKNEEVTIPNGIVLNSSVVNFSRAAQTRGLILHTSVTIGYDAPWRIVHQLLIDAAGATPGVMADPAPFVWQTALNDFYVTYEINAYTEDPAAMPEMYAALHARIQDAFYAAGVEIMSPHYASLRDGNTVAIPESSRPPGYRAPAHRVERVGPRLDVYSERGGTPPSSSRPLAP